MWYDRARNVEGGTAMRVAVVDDSAADRLWLAGELKTLLARRGLEGTVTAFDCGESFLAAAQVRRFGLVFLDIYMEGLGGVQTAERLREFDPDCLLVFSTSSPDHALEGYRVQAVQYLVKPYHTAELERLFVQLDRLLPAPERYVELRAERRTVRVRLRDILWAEHFQHQVRLHIPKGETLSTRLTFGAFT